MAVTIDRSSSTFFLQHGTEQSNNEQENGGADSGSRAAVLLIIREIEINLHVSSSNGSGGELIVSIRILVQRIRGSLELIEALGGFRFGFRGLDGVSKNSRGNKLGERAPVFSGQGSETSRGVSLGGQLDGGVGGRGKSGSQRVGRRRS